MKNIELCLLAILIISITAGFAFAAHVLKEASGDSEVSINEDSSSAIINISINNTNLGSSLNISQVNVTLYNNFLFTADSNGSGDISSVVVFSNTSTVLTWTNRTLLINGTGTINGTAVVGYFWLNVTATNPGTYNITVSTFNGSVFKQNITIRVNDTTAPNVTVTYPTNNTNISGTSIDFNITIIDNNRTEACWYSLNDSGTNYSMSNMTATMWNATNASIANGHYIAQFWCNDSAGNINKTVNTLLTIDTTDPIISSFSCTPSSVTTDEIVTCSCGGTDNLDANPTASFTEKPSTSSAGTFTLTCNVSDHASNSAATTTTYTVDYPASGTVSGGSSYSKTIVQDLKEFSEIKTYSKSIEKNTRIRIKMDGKKHSIGLTDLTSTIATIEIFSTPQTATLSIGDERRFDLNGDGYYDLEIILNSIDQNKASLTLNSVYEKITEETQKQEQEKEEKAKETEEGVKEAEKEKDLTWLWILIVVIIVILIIVGYIIKKK